MTRNGKIARLPRAVREELNRRLDNGEPGPQLLAWLNARDDVRAILAAHFAGGAINAPNLTAWKQGGLVAWQAQQELRERVEQIAGDAAALAESGGPLADHLSMSLAARYALALADWDGKPGAAAKQQLQALSAICRDLVALRKSDHHAARLRMELEQYARERQLALEKEEREKAWRAKCAAAAAKEAEEEDEDDEDEEEADDDMDENEEEEDGEDDDDGEDMAEAESRFDRIIAVSNRLLAGIERVMRNHPELAKAAIAADEAHRARAISNLLPSELPPGLPPDFPLAIPPETPPPN